MERLERLEPCVRVPNVNRSDRSNRRAARIEQKTFMDFKLTEEQKLIQNTAAQFVKRELLSREGAYLKQEELFLPPGDPPRART